MIRKLYSEAESLTAANNAECDLIEYDLTSFHHFVFNAHKIQYKLDSAYKMLMTIPRL